MKSCADDKARERMISAQRDHVLELCESDHVRFTNASRVGLRTNRLEEDRALPAQNRPKFVRTSLRPWLAASETSAETSCNLLYNQRGTAVTEPVTPR